MIKYDDSSDTFTEWIAVNLEQLLSEVRLELARQKEEARDDRESAGIIEGELRETIQELEKVNDINVLIIKRLREERDAYKNDYTNTLVSISLDCLEYTDVMRTISKYNITTVLDMRSDSVKEAYGSIYHYDVEQMLKDRKCNYVQGIDVPDHREHIYSTRSSIRTALLSLVATGNVLMLWGRHHFDEEYQDVIDYTLRFNTTLNEVQLGKWNQEAI